MSMYGAHVETRDIRGNLKETRVCTYSTWGGCFAGLGHDTARHLADDLTAIETVTLAHQRRGQPINDNNIAAQIDFLFSPFVQRLTDHAFLAHSVPHRDTKMFKDRNFDDLHQQQPNILQSVTNVRFIPHRHQDLMITAFRISKQHTNSGHDLASLYRDLPRKDWWAIPISIALQGADGECYSDSSVVFGTPTAEELKEYAQNQDVEELCDLYYDDLEDHFREHDFTHITEQGVADMLVRTTKQFSDYCRQGMGDLISGYTKDCGLSMADLNRMRPDDPVGLAAPMRMTTYGGRRIGSMTLRQVIDLVVSSTN